MGYEFREKGFISNRSEVIKKRKFEVVVDNIIRYHQLFYGGLLIGGTEF